MKDKMACLFLLLQVFLADLEFLLSSQQGGFRQLVLLGNLIRLLEELRARIQKEGILMNQKPSIK